MTPTENFFWLRHCSQKFNSIKGRPYRSWCIIWHPPQPKPTPVASMSILNLLRQNFHRQMYYGKSTYNTNALVSLPAQSIKHKRYAAASLCMWHNHQLLTYAFRKFSWIKQMIFQYNFIGWENQINLVYTSALERVRFSTKIWCISKRMCSFDK